jgi:hypothetical protein
MQKGTVTNRQFEFQNVTLSVAVSVCNPDFAPFAIHRPHPAPTPSGFAEIVSDYFPILHLDFARIRCLSLNATTDDSKHYTGNDDYRGKNKVAVPLLDSHFL